MTIAERRTEQAGSPARPKRRWGPHAATVIVLVIGLGITIMLCVVTARGHQRTNYKLLALQTRLIGNSLATSGPLYVEDHLGAAARLAAATNGDVATFRNDMGASVTAKGPFAAASLWRLGGSAPQLVTAVGTKPILTPRSPAAAALLRRAAASKTFVVTKLVAGHEDRIGLATAASGTHGGFVAYAEEPVPGSRRSAPANPLTSNLNIALYLGRAQTSAALLEADSAAPLPLRGTTYTTRIPFGDTVLTLTASARTSLTGSLGVILPWAAGIVGLLLTIAAALLTERLVRRRTTAERRSTEVGLLYEEQRSVAETLQHALLPQRLPTVSGMQIAVRYLPGASGVDIGGDWYDVIPLQDGRFVFVVGDVSGRGVSAAAMMASLQFASRAYALEGHPPSRILDQLTKSMEITRDGHFATVLCGLVDVGIHQVTLANAGHLPPLICSEAGASLVTTTPGSPIGIPGPVSFASAVVTTAAKGTLIAYTDGLVERRGETLDAGLKRLQDAAATRSSSPLEDMLSSIVAELTGNSPADDVALIGLRWLN